MDWINRSHGWDKQVMWMGHVDGKFCMVLCLSMKQLILSDNQFWSLLVYLQGMCKACAANINYLQISYIFMKIYIPVTDLVIKGFALLSYFWDFIYSISTALAGNFTLCMFGSKEGGGGGGGGGHGSRPPPTPIAKKLINQR